METFADMMALNVNNLRSRLCYKTKENIQIDIKDHKYKTFPVNQYLQLNILESCYKITFLLCHIEHIMS